MTELYDSQKKANSDLQKLLKERIENKKARRELTAKIDEQIQLAAYKDYTPTQHKWGTNEHGDQRKVEVAKRVKRWWKDKSCSSL